MRDLGGHPTADGAQTRRGAVVRADSLARLTDEGKAALEAYGIRTIIDFRVPVEVRDDPNPYTEHGSIATHHLPLDPNDRPVTKATAAHKEAGLSHMAAVNAAFLAVNREQVATIMRAIANAPAGGVLIHCHSGRDRTGLIAAMLLALAGVPADAIVADYDLSFGAVGGTMEATLAHLERAYGGVTAYLRAAGMTEEEIARLSTRLRDDAAHHE